MLRIFLHTCTTYVLETYNKENKGKIFGKKETEEVDVRACTELYAPKWTKVGELFNITYEI